MRRLRCCRREVLEGCPRCGGGPLFLPYWLKVGLLRVGWSRVWAPEAKPQVVVAGWVGCG
nr:MAG TPA: restriction alleviation protein [Caudoviricetes sp.]